MTPRHPLLKPASRPAEPPRLRQEPPSATWSVRQERTRDLRSEVRDESECFEQLLASPQGLGQGAVVDVSDDRGQQSSSQEQEHASASQPPDSQAATLWQALLDRLEEHLEERHEGPLEVQLELPNLGPVAVRVQSRGHNLDIALRFARDAAWQYCSAQRQASADWLARQLGRPVQVTLQREVH